MASEERDWANFIRITAGRPAWPELVRAAKLLPGPGDALDFGCGAGRDTRYLLQHGFRVTAVDGSPLAGRALRRLPRQRMLSFVEARFEDFEPDPAGYDLVNALYSLPFIPTEVFEPTVRRLLGSVRPGGALSCNFFGPHDTWALVASDVHFVTRAEVEAYLEGFDLRELDEEDADGETADGSPKHWHIFHVVATRP